MPWAKPLYPRYAVDAAGRVIGNQSATPDDRATAIAVINNWRSSHYFPLNTFRIGLRARAREIDQRGFVAQRIKRIASIQSKLKRLPMLTLSEMQDIGGCRAVVSSVDAVRNLVSSYKNGRQRHVLDDEDDYINSPRKSGYRSHHLIYRYRSDRSETYNGLKIEIQVRSRFQHVWATAVETVGVFTKQALKSNSGDDNWRRFFALMGSAFALREKTPLVPRTPATARELQDEIKDLVQRLGVLPKLESYSAATLFVNKSKAPNAALTLLELNSQTVAITVTHYGPGTSESERAFLDYSRAEERVADQASLDAVLVSTDSFRHLRRAFPNYFVDTHLFLQYVVGELSRRS